VVLGPGRLPARPIYARALFGGRISMSELALRSRIAAVACCSRLRRGQRDRFLSLWQVGGPLAGRVRAYVSRPRRTSPESVRGGATAYEGRGRGHADPASVPSPWLGGLAPSKASWIF
jgi:hypothetical protein